MVFFRGVSGNLYVLVMVIRGEVVVSCGVLHGGFCELKKCHFFEKYFG